MALGHLTPATATVETPLAPVVTINAARARAEWLLRDAARLERVANGQETPQEDDKALSLFHLTLTGMVAARFAEAALWDAKAQTAERYGRPQPEYGAEVPAEAYKRR